MTALIMALDGLCHLAEGRVLFPSLSRTYYIHNTTLSTRTRTATPPTPLGGFVPTPLRVCTVPGQDGG